MDHELVLAARGVNAFYGVSQILFGLELKVYKGRVMALLGRNGAGKSTTMKCLMGLVEPRAGEITLQGEPIQGLAPHRIARRGLGYVPEDRQVFTHHTVHDNLEIALKEGADGSSHWTIEKIYETFPTLDRLRNNMAGRMSGGEQQILSIARTLAGNPTVLLLDEPSEGLAPIIVAQIANLILELRASGSTILLAEQSIQFCLKVATDVSIINKGSIVHVSTIDEFRDDNAIKSRYLAA